MILRPGLRLRGTCGTGVVVIRAPEGHVDLRCSGEPMSDDDGATLPAAPEPHGTLLGKRYVSADGAVELLCIRAGRGALAVGDAPMSVKAAKPLPSSD